MELYATTFWGDGPAADGRPAGWPRAMRQVKSADELRDGEALKTEAELQQIMADLTPQMEAWKASRTASEPYVIEDLWFERLTRAERKILRAAARAGTDEAEDLADAIDIMRSGQMVWPAGNGSRLQKNARNVRQVLRRFFTADRVNEITARPS